MPVNGQEQECNGIVALLMFIRACVIVMSSMTPLFRRVRLREDKKADRVFIEPGKKSLSYKKSLSFQKRNGA